MEISTISAAKERIRESLENRAESFPFITPGKIAEALRREKCYREAATIFVGPAPVLSQIRINALVDGKNLIMPAAGLKDGFYLVQISAVPFARIGMATTPKGLPQYGSRLSLEQLREHPISILINDAQTVDQAGTRIGHGQGFFDLACAILAEAEGLSPGYIIWGVLPKECITDELLPRDPWDVPVNGILLETGIRHLSAEPHQPEILWPALAHGRIRKIAPLWQLHSRP